MITELQPNEIFVFGANREGRHVAGAARTAAEKFGAIEGQGEGLQGQSYGVNTMSGWPAFISSARKFNEFALNNPQYTFLLTKVGCGIAGYEEKAVMRLFWQAPKNVIRPDGWV